MRARIAKNVNKNSSFTHMVHFVNIVHSIHLHASIRAQKKLILVSNIHHAAREIFSVQIWNSVWSHPTIWSKIVFVVRSAEKSE